MKINRIQGAHLQRQLSMPSYDLPFCRCFGEQGPLSGLLVYP